MQQTQSLLRQRKQQQQHEEEEEEKEKSTKDDTLPVVFQSSTNGSSSGSSSSGHNHKQYIPRAPPPRVNYSRTAVRSDRVHSSVLASLKDNGISVDPSLSQRSDCVLILNESGSGSGSGSGGEEQELGAEEEREERHIVRVGFSLFNRLDRLNRLYIVNMPVCSIAIY